MNISKSRFFLKNPALLLFYRYSPLTSCKKSVRAARAVRAVRAVKSLDPFLRKLRYQPTNQPTDQLLTATSILLNLADAGPITH